MAPALVSVSRVGIGTIVATSVSCRIGLKIQLKIGSYLAAGGGFVELSLLRPLAVEYCGRSRRRKFRFMRAVGHLIAGSVSTAAAPPTS